MEEMKKNETTNAIISKGENFLKKPVFDKIGIRSKIKKNFDSVVKPSDEAALLRLYGDLLGNRNNTFAMDVGMLLNEAIPAFEKQFGSQTFNKFKKYIGFEVKKPQKNALRPGEYQSIINRMRTVENAMYYIPGYKELVKKMAQKVIAPSGMSDLVKAKLLRMYLIVFCGYYYFLEDFQEVNVDGRMCFRVNVSLAESNNKKALHPEEMFELMQAKFSESENDGIYYEIIEYEFNKLDRIQKSLVLDFAELDYDKNDGFTSVNKAKSWTFGAVRQIKQKVFTLPGVAPMELFASEDVLKKASFVDAYTIYKILSTKPIESFRKINRNMAVLEGSRFVNKEFTCYEFMDGFEVTGVDEIQRYIHLYEFIVKNHSKMLSGYLDLSTELIDSWIYDGAIKFAYEMGYISDYTKPEDDLNLAILIVKKDEASFNIPKYLEGDLSAIKLRETLDFDNDFEIFVRRLREESKVNNAVVDEIIETQEKIQDETKVEIHSSEKIEMENKTLIDSNDDIVAKLIEFAKEYEIADENSQGIRELISNVIIASKKSEVMQFVQRKISSDKFRDMLGMDEEFEKMFFNLESVDIWKIEQKLMDLKRKRTANKKQYAILIYLYVYLIENQIACGKKHKVPKRNKNLKTENLMARVN